MSELINLAEMEELTGAKNPSKQCEVLRHSGVRFIVRADGRPALSWEAYNRQMATLQPAETPMLEPNLRAI